jgi:hypothetical protein
MKTLFLQIAFVAVTCGLMTSVSYGDLLTDEERAEYIASNASLETLRINDQTEDTNLGTPNSLYRIFNEYFQNELTSNYTSGSELVAERMIKRTISSWQVNPGSNIAASFASASWQHGLQIYSTTGALLFDTGQYTSTTTGEAIIDGIPIDLNGGNYVFSVNGIGLSKAFSGEHEWYYSTEDYLGNDWMGQYYEDGIEHLIAFDVTDLMQQRDGYKDIESAFLFTMEDLHISVTDFDYQDFAFILTNVKANVVPAATPEPATILIFGIAGGIALPFLRRKNKKNNNSKKGWATFR